MRTELKAISQVIRIFVVGLFFTTLLTSPVYAETNINEFIKDFMSMTNSDVGTCKYSSEELTNGADSQLDDSNWEDALGRNYRGQIIFFSRDSLIWFRKLIVVPKTIYATKVEGGNLNLLIDVGPCGSIYLNGKHLNDFNVPDRYFRPDGQRITLTENARPGQKFLVAVRAESKGESIWIASVKLELDKGTALAERIKTYIKEIKIANKLLERPAEIRGNWTKLILKLEETRSKIPEERIDSLKKDLMKAIKKINLEAMRQGETQLFVRSLDASYKALEPLANFSKEYTISLIGNAHIDLAWLWRWIETVEVCRNTFSRALSFMNKYPDYTYAQSQAHAYWWMEKKYPKIFQSIKQWVKNERWEIVGGMWCEPDCNLPNGESWIRQILYAVRYFQKKFGVDVKIGWNPDSFGYNWNMPQFYKRSGINAFITQKIGWNDTNVFPYRLFWWEAPDGSRILSYFPFSYTGEAYIDQMVDWLVQFESITGYPNLLVLYGRGDHGGGPTEDMIQRALEYKKLRVCPNIVMTTASDYINNIPKDLLENIPVWKNELYLEYHRGTYTNQVNIKKWNRKSEILMMNTEKLATIANLLGSEYSREELLPCWRILLFNQFHDILPGSSIHEVYVDAEKEFKQLRKICNESLNRSFETISSKVNTQDGPNGLPIVIFNFLSWERNGLVSLGLPENYSKGMKVVDEKGNEVHCQVIYPLDDDEPRLIFIAREVPAIGYKVYKLQEGKSTDISYNLSIRGTTIENDFYRINVDSNTGCITKIYDKINERETLDGSGKGNILQCFEDIPDRWDGWNIGYTGKKWDLDSADSVKVIEKGPVKAAIRVYKSFLGSEKTKYWPTENFPSSFFIQDIILYNGIHRIDCQMKVDWWEKHVLLKTAFPIEVRSDKATYEIPYGHIVRSTLNKTPQEKAQFEVPALKWADLSQSDYGVSLLNDCKYGYDIKENVMRLTLLRSPLWPDPMANRGESYVTYSLYPHKGDWRDGNTVRKAYELNCPLMSKVVSNHKGELSLSHSFFKALPNNIVMTAIKKAEDSDDLILRLYESFGQDSKAEIVLPKKPTDVVLTNLMEEVIPSSEITINENIIEVPIDKNAIMTVKVTF